VLTLYYTPGACSRASHLALREAEARFELYNLNFAADEQRSPEYLRINPKGRVPALATPRGVITENPAILAYIAQSHPAARLAPLDDAFEFARMQAFNSDLCATVHVAHAHLRRAERWADDAAARAELRRKAPSVVDACFALMNSEMVGAPWVLGDAFSVADCYLFTLTEWLPEHGLDVGRYPVIAAHHARMRERTAVQETLAAER